MASPVSNNLSLILMETGTASGAWGSTLNSSMISIVDQALGTSASVSVSSSDVALTTTQRQNLALVLTGTLTTNLNVTLPLSPNSTTAAVGGQFIFWNNTTGAFNVTIKTVASGSVGVAVPQGSRSTLYSNGTNIYFADDSRIAKITSTAGSPNGSMTGTAASVNTPADLALDRTTNTPYICTTSGTATGAVWSVLAPFFPSPGGYLTNSASTQDVILTADSIGGSGVAYSPYMHNIIPIYNGTNMAPVPFTQLILSNSVSAQGANQLYDVFAFLNPSGGAVTIGYGPAWTTATAGSCSRGAGAGTTQISRNAAAGLAGPWVNTNAMNLNNGATTYSISAFRGTYLGTVWIDATAGQCTCHRSWGQSRKFGVWNAYNRVPLYLKAGDSTSSWAYNTATWRASDGSSANSLTVLCGLAEETIKLELAQRIQQTQGANQAATPALTGIGWNSTTSPSGVNGALGCGTGGGVSVNPLSVELAQFYQVPSLGINTVTAIEQGNANGSTFFGTEASMVLSAMWRG